MTHTPIKKERLLTFSSGGWVILLAAVLSLLAAFLVLLPVFQTGFRRAVGDGKHVDTYGFDLSNLSIPKSLLIASGKAKDEIRAVPPNLVEPITPAEVQLMNTNEHYHYLIPKDRVIGVAINGEARAYPLRFMNLHEVLNDTVGGTPIAVTWSSLCGAAVVFDRRINGENPVEFGVSGLLYNSDLIMFDRRSEEKDESLWVQLQMKAVSGVRGGKMLTTVPYELVTWGEWTKLHPETRVFMGLRTLKEQYGDAQDPFNLYLTMDQLSFPVTPIWNRDQQPLKTEIVVRQGFMGWTAAKSGDGVHAFLFAWYAQHPKDTDYSAILK